MTENPVWAASMDGKTVGLFNDFKDWHRVQFYMTDEQKDAVIDEWAAWIENRKAEHMVRASSASYTGHRFLTFYFKDEDDAALFKLWFTK